MAVEQAVINGIAKNLVELIAIPFDEVKDSEQLGDIIESILALGASVGSISKEDRAEAALRTLAKAAQLGVNKYFEEKNKS